MKKNKQESTAAAAAQSAAAKKSKAKETAAAVSPVTEVKKKSIWVEIWHSRYIYLMLIPFFVWLIIFHYGPMYGLQLAFKKYSARLGIWGSEWVGLANFRRILITPKAYSSIWNTIWISLGRLIFQFPFPIMLAILINEMRGRKLKRVYQTIFTFPHFLSWIIVSAILTNFLSMNGAINSLLSFLGQDKVNFLTSKPLFTALLFITANWKGIGWGAIVYLAAISGIDPTLYDAAKVDGANRWQQIWYITLAELRSIIAIMFILDIGGLMNAGFDQIFNMRNAVVSESVNILDTYVYDITFSATPNYGFSTAVGLFKSLINFALLMLANEVVGKLTGQKMYSFKKEGKK